MNNSAIHEHVLSCNHAMDLQNFHVIAHAQNSYDLDTFENVLIVNKKLVLNVQAPSGQLHLF